MTYADVIRQLRTDAGLTQREAALRVGFHSNTWAQWERGERFPQVDAHKRLREAFGEYDELYWRHVAWKVRTPATAPTPRTDHRS